MGVSYKALSIIGLELDKYDLFETRKIKTFSHNYDENFHFDPKTGQVLWKNSMELKTILEKYKKNHTKYALHEYDLHDYPVLYQDIHTENIVFVCMKYIDSSYGQNKHMNIPRQSEIDEFKSKMQQLTLWDENKFGIHNYLYVY